MTLSGHCITIEVVNMSNIQTGRHPAKGGNGGLQTRTPPAPFGGHPSKGALRPLYGRFAPHPCHTHRRLFFGPPRSVFWRAVFGFLACGFFVRFLLFFLTLFSTSLTEASGFGRYHLMGSKYPPFKAPH